MRIALKTLPLLALLALAAPLAGADDGRRVGPLLPKYAQECGSCHLAYPPGALPNASWHRLLRNLPRHFGTDASVDAVTLKEITAWVDAHPQTWKRVGEAPPEDRITRSAWFQRKHREIAPAAFKRAAIQSAANCAACHPRADQGDFDEDSVRIPR
jgi:Dihaem cytochrome c